MTQSFVFAIYLPQSLKAAAETLLRFAKLRCSYSRDRSSKPCYYLKAIIPEASYNEAKKAQTQRNLNKAVQLYARSASEGEKIDSCIKDFASVIHQMGYTKFAVQFLLKLRQYYEGDMKRYDRLTTTLQKQIQPSIKHDCKSILFELPNRSQPSKEFLSSIFANTTRIRNIKVLNSLDFTLPSEQKGKWFIFQFQSFSAAKKTIEKFKFQDWFGINKYWIKDNLIACEALDGREDFDKGYVVTVQIIEKNLQRFWSYADILLWTESDKGKFYNECAKMLIEENLARQVPTEDEINTPK